MFGTQEVVGRPYGTVTTGVAGQAAWGLDLGWQRFGPGRTLGGDLEGSAERQRPRGWVLAAMVAGAFVMLCAFLGFLFMQHGSDGWLASSMSWFGDKPVTPKTAP